jgi:hypothetical protein
VREERVGGRLEKKGSCEDSKRPLPIVILHVRGVITLPALPGA